jgi:hypothetical protein
MMLQTRISGILLPIVFSFALIFLVSALAEGELVTPRKGELSSCETQLKESFAIRHSVTLPVAGPAFRISCPSGGTGTCHVKWSWRFLKANFVSAGGLGSPDNFIIENHGVVIEEQSAGSIFTHSHDAASVFGLAEVEKGRWFGGGQTIRFRVTAILRENMSDATATVIGRMCGARVFSPGEPR